MKMKSLLWGLVLAGACGTDVDPDLDLDGDDGGDKLGGDAGDLEIFVSAPNGARVTGNLFASKADVYLNALLDGAPPAPFGAMSARDYYFHVVDGAGHMVSTDDPLCRRLRIGETGRIEVIYGGIVDGVACPHNSGVDLLNPFNRGLTVGLAPFADSALVTAGGDASYAVELFPADNFEGITEPAVTIPFIVAEPGPRCGDGELDPGEACDDGNSVNGDGCNGMCEYEMSTPPPAAVCGNGVVEDGEGCDDGNTAGMDGCNAMCEVEHLCCCGNGELEPGEACDDGNQHDGDGCSSQCTVE